MNIRSKAIALAVMLAGGAQAQVALLTRLIQDAVVAPGEVHAGHIALRNQGTASETVTLHQADFATQCDGGRKFDRPAGRRSRSNAPWISLERDRVTIDPGTTVRIGYSVRVPTQGGLDGSYWSVIVASVVPRTTEPLVTKPRNPKEFVFTFSPKFSYASLILTHVGVPKAGDLEIQDRQVIQTKEQRCLRLGVATTGSYVTEAKIWADLFGLDGSSQGRIKGQNARAYPGDCANFDLDLSTVPAGTYKAQVVLDAGGDQVFGATYDLELD